MANQNIFQMVSQIRQNPMGFLASMGINIPQNIGTNPNDITKYLIDSGKVSQQQYDQAVKMANQFKR